MIEIGVMVFIASCLAYLSFQLVGVTITSLVTLLVKPVLYYWASHTLFEEQLPTPLLLGSAGIVAVLACATLFLS
jgi:hypothetical protein